MVHNQKSLQHVRLNYQNPTFPDPQPPIHPIHQPIHPLILPRFPIPSTRSPLQIPPQKQKPTSSLKMVGPIRYAPSAYPKMVDLLTSALQEAEKIQRTRNNNNKKKQPKSSQNEEAVAQRAQYLRWHLGPGVFLAFTQLTAD
ncbi:hypothetical protein QBC38DRAFT_186656 [Podospora fimiseda]|uniref:Uncharacterized protein n=1 Tax=Podospora fimiseda TaxID=252190 RepID=A0AAN7BQE1_9PEZI|nr:hypothetical protein QBC38DRAFT_186656 [Podospora fimiseda]